MRLIIRRNVFNPRNSMCGSARIRELSPYWWWTDNSDPATLCIYALRWSDRTYHRVGPRQIPGYTCKRIEMRNQMYGTKLFWICDANAGDQVSSEAR